MLMLSKKISCQRRPEKVKKLRTIFFNPTITLGGCTPLEVSAPKCIRDQLMVSWEDGGMIDDDGFDVGAGFCILYFSLVIASPWRASFSLLSATVATLVEGPVPFDRMLLLLLRLFFSLFSRYALVAKLVKF